MSEIVAPGVYNLKESAYLADPCDLPSLSASIAKILLEKSPDHARSAHPKLGGKYEPHHTTEKDLGSALHSLILTEDWKQISVIDYADWRTKAARELREEAYETGHHPILAKDSRRLAEIAHAVSITGIIGGFPVPEERHIEQTMIFREYDVPIRFKPDYLTVETDGRVRIVDLKTTQLPATRNGWGRRQIFDYLVQCGLYTHGARHLFGTDNVTFDFVVVETSPPYGMATMTFDSIGHALAATLATQAIKTWADCLLSQDWPSYPAETLTIETPPWIITDRKDG